MTDKTLQERLREVAAKQRLSMPTLDNAIRRAKRFADEAPHIAQLFQHELDKVVMADALDAQEARIIAAMQETAKWKRKAEEAARDAARYRWLRSKARLEYMNPRAMEDCRMEWTFPRLFGMTCVMTEIPVDEAIDALIAAKGEA